MVVSGVTNWRFYGVQTPFRREFFSQFKSEIKINRPLSLITVNEKRDLPSNSVTLNKSEKHENEKNVTRRKELAYLNFVSVFFFFWIFRIFVFSSSSETYIQGMGCSEFEKILIFLRVLFNFPFLAITRGLKIGQQY